jgi:hypothetical protein
MVGGGGGGRPLFGFVEGVQGLSLTQISILLLRIEELRNNATLNLLILAVTPRRDQLTEGGLRMVVSAYEWQQGHWDTLCSHSL